MLSLEGVHLIKLKRHNPSKSITVLRIIASKRHASLIMKSTGLTLLTGRNGFCPSSKVTSRHILADQSKAISASIESLHAMFCLGSDDQSVLWSLRELFASLCLWRERRERHGDGMIRDRWWGYVACFLVGSQSHDEDKRLYSYVTSVEHLQSLFVCCHTRENKTFQEDYIKILMIVWQEKNLSRTRRARRAEEDIKFLVCLEAE